MFCAPRGAALLRLQVQAGTSNGTFYMDDLRLEDLPVAKGAALVLDLTRVGDAPGSVYGLNTYTSRRRLPDGSVAFSGSPGPVPLAAGSYRLDVAARPLPNGYHNLRLTFRDAAGKELGKAEFGADLTGPLRFEAPEGTATVRFAVWAFRLRELRFTRDE